MSKQSITNYYNKLDQYKLYGGTGNESSIRRAFANLLEDYCIKKKLILVDELHLKNSTKIPDGTVRDALQQDWGHWESKDEKDILDDAIEKKFAIGYPQDNIIFENSKEIILIQKSEEVMRGSMRDSSFLNRILIEFTNYQHPEITNFHNAIEKFKQNVPDILEILRTMISEQAVKNPKFKKARKDFWKICKDSINSEISAFDIREMLIQHILTHEIFTTIFDDADFHRENNIAQQLQALVDTFFTRTIKKNTLSKIDTYYKTIKKAAAGISNHHEKQKFLKVIYENFYKSYNPKGADRLGIVYTPNEIVKFMIESTDYLLDKHFGKQLQDKNVEILDPATGTGTYITDIIEHIPTQYLEYKYKNEIHCNELAILPYYIANLNIEYTYMQKMQHYEPFNNIVFVDTLENFGFSYEGKQEDIFNFSIENLLRIKKQNKSKISVIIGNPPYNANQQNENDNNKNREYPEIDKRIKNTYVKYSTAQKTKVYDMYSRFYRWASDRIDKNGIIAFITNRSFIESRTFDGFRKIVEQEFDFVYIIDTQSDVRKNPKIAGTSHNVFGIQTGVAIMFLIKNNLDERIKANIRYYTLTDKMLKKEKLDWLSENPLKYIPFEIIKPDKYNNWLNIPDNDFDELLPIADKETKLAKNKVNEKAIFKLFSNGVVTARDEWVYDFDKKNLKSKVEFFINSFLFEKERWKKSNKKQKIADFLKRDIKFSDTLKKHLLKIAELEETLTYLQNLPPNGKRKKIKELKQKLLPYKDFRFKRNKIKINNYRPFIKQFYYAEKILSDRLTQNHYAIFGNELNKENKVIGIMGVGIDRKYFTIAVDKIIDLQFIPNGQSLPLYTYDKSGNRIENITDWGLEQFTNHYKTAKISKLDIFNYTYGVLNNPAYRKKYELNLKRELPRLPFYKDFYKWVNWGKKLTNLHINYEKIVKYKLQIIENENPKENPKAKLRRDKITNEIILDENTIIKGIPDIAFDYKLGSRSAIDWILDQYKEKKPRYKTIREKFNTYKFADYKNHVIDLIQRLTTVSVKTMEIVNLMEAEEQHNIII